MRERDVHRAPGAASVLSVGLGTLLNMGTNNRQRRAEKARRRARDRGRPRPADTGSQQNSEYPWVADGVGAAVALDHLIRLRMTRGRASLALSHFASHPERAQQQAIDAELSRVVDGLFGAGWTPVDLYEVSRRRADESLATHLVQVAAEATSRHPSASVDSRWQAQLDAFGSSASRASVQDWADRAGVGWPAAVIQFVDLLVNLCMLPVVQTVLPRPGSRIGPGPAHTDGIDQKVLRRVRALLAKAESTEFDEEADALTSKAQQLMTEHSIAQSLAEADQVGTPRPGARRLWLAAPYVLAKSLLVSAVADANHSRSVIAEGLGFVTIVGHDRDLDVVELLTTSLLVQATRAMTQAGRQVSRSGTSRTRSYRQSFLVAYAGRIGERLRHVADDIEVSADSASGGALLPVLASRQHAVDDQLDELFPELRQRGVSVSDAAGYGAGRAAADLARLELGGALETSTGTG